MSRPTPEVTRRRAWRRVTLGIAAIALVAAISGVIHTIASRREALMAGAAESARAAVADARGAGAALWAPLELQHAEQASREALTAQRVELTRVWPVPAAARVIEEFGRTETLARTAAAAAGERRSRAESSARAQIEAAHRLVSASESMAEKLRVGKERRSLLASARLAVEEARVFQRAGDYRNATVRALRAEELNARVQEHAATVVERYADPATIARWRRWIDDTVAWSKREGRAAIVVAKEAHRLTLYRRGVALATYTVDLGFNWTADKLHEGDGATPEGRYRVVARLGRSASIYHKALLLDYPNAGDRAEFTRARRDGALPAGARIGGLIEIHGGGGRDQDWTDGCVALANTDMDRVFELAGVGTPVTIVGSDEYGAIAEFADRRRAGADGRRP
ncbi:MAG: L,D-transpeptidase family protein [Vicinamibacterales bacterium]